MTNLEQKIVNSIDDLSQILTSSNLVLTTAESCTGGWLAKFCTDRSGSSKWFDCGIVSYSNHSKQKLLNVQQDTLTEFGAVSIQTASEMVRGALVNSTADIAVSITGIAGPDGGTKEKPVGTVWFAWQVRNGSVITACHHFNGERNLIRQQAVIIAIQGIIKNARDSTLYMG